MNTPIPPVIPSSAIFNALQANQDLRTFGSSISNGYSVGKGSIITLDGAYVTYTPAQICGGVIIRTGVMAQGPQDTLPSATSIAQELALPNEDGTSFIRYLSFYIPGNQPTTISGTGWVFPGTNYLRQEGATSFALCISYSIQSGWNINALSNGFIDLS